jgi:hypothetical protein
MHTFYETVTVAGKSRYLEAAKLKEGIVMPSEFKTLE